MDQKWQDCQIDSDVLGPIVTQLQLLKILNGSEAQGLTNNKTARDLLLKSSDRLRDPREEEK